MPAIERQYAKVALDSAAIPIGDTFRSPTGTHLWRASAIKIREQDEYKHYNNEYENS